jgi:hypothetical protein
MQTILVTAATSRMERSYSWNNQIVRLRQSCNGGEIEFNWKSIQQIRFDTSCVHPKYEMSTSPVTTIRPCKTITVYQIQFKGLKEVSYASSITLADGKLTINFYNQSKPYETAVADMYRLVDWMNRVELCPDEIKSFPIPGMP